MTKCPDCGRRAILGKCRFGGPNVVIMPHCRRCCAAPERDGWRPTAPPPRAAKPRARAATPAAGRRT